MTLVFLLEERSIQEMLKGLLPRVLPSDIGVRYIVFEGKHDMEQQVVRKLRSWRYPDSVFVVLRDQDGEDCRIAKKKLSTKCSEAGKPGVLVRIVCRELESWYFGDLTAVEKALHTSGLARYGRKKQYRVPDEIRHPAAELSKITNDRYQKIAGSRAIGRELSPDDNKSISFSVFLRGLRQICGVCD